MTQEQFEKYDKENPQIYKEFEKTTRTLIGVGKKNYSAMAIMQIIRWHSEVEGNDSYKVNHNYFPLYARKFMDLNPEHKGFFRTKKLKNDRA